MKRSIDGKKFTLALPLLVAAALALGGCEPLPPCDDSLQEGERFQITILEHETASSACQSHVPSLSAGESFTLVAGPKVSITVNEGDGASRICSNHGAVGDAPPFALGGLTSCATDAEYQLGLMCEGADPSGCGLSVEELINTRIPAGVSVIDHATLLMTWRNKCEVGSCFQQYDVRIERLAAPPGA